MGRESALKSLLSFCNFTSISNCNFTSGKTLKLKFGCFYRAPKKLMECNVFSPSVCPRATPDVTTIIDGIGYSQVTWGLPRPVQTCSLGTNLLLPALHPPSLKTCSLCNPYIYQKAGGWPLTERSSCLRSTFSHFSFVDCYICMSCAWPPSRPQYD